MSNGSKYECPMKSMAQVRHPVLRSGIERFSQSVGTEFVFDVQLGMEPAQARAGGPCVKQVHEMDNFILDVIRVFREIDTCFERRTFEPLSIVNKIDRKGE
jgi:hypothetical protein